MYPQNESISVDLPAPGFIQGYEDGFTDLLNGFRRNPYSVTPR